MRISEYFPGTHQVPTMPGTTGPTFGTRLFDASVAVGLASLLVTAVYVLRGTVDDPRRFATVSGVGYALVCFGTYAIPRYLLDAFVAGVFTAPFLVWVLVFVLPVLAAQGGVPAYLYADRGSVGALGGLFLATIATIWYHLALGGESDVLVLYPAVLPAIAAVLIAGAIAVEVGARATVDSIVG